jgi:hypothetical protein
MAMEPTRLIVNGNSVSVAADAVSGRIPVLGGVRRSVELTSIVPIWKDYHPRRRAIGERGYSADGRHIGPFVAVAQGALLSRRRQVLSDVTRLPLALLIAVLPTAAAGH